MQQSTDARDRRSALFQEDREYFLQLLRCDLKQLLWDARQRGMIPAARLNGTSDLPWERICPEIFEEFADTELQFFDYTKLAPRMRSFLRGKLGDQPWPSNYHLTFSLSENNACEAETTLYAGGNVAVVFWPVVPQSWKGFEVVDGDQHDARFMDPLGTVVGLGAKGIARKDLSGFVVQTDNSDSLLSQLQHAS